MRPQSIEWICANCSTNIDDNWWWCPICGHDVNIKEIHHYSTFQKFIIATQEFFGCVNKPQLVNKTTQTEQYEDKSTQTPVRKEVDEVTSYKSKKTKAIIPTYPRIYRESYV
jgi:hypothetical protein